MASNVFNRITILSKLLFGKRGIEMFSRLGFEPGVALGCPPLLRLFYGDDDFGALGAPEARGGHFGHGPGVAPECHPAIKTLLWKR